MSTAENFKEWAIAQGVKFDGVGIQEFSGRGFGLLATKDLKTDEIILLVPTSALRNISTVPKSTSSALAATKLPISVNGILALSLLQSTPKTPWDAMLPTRTSLLTSIPFTWHPTIQSLLPPDASILLQKQQKKIGQDWKAVSAAFPETDYDEYIYHWFLVSTRTFYWTAPKKKGMKNNGRAREREKKNIDHDDCISLAPFADLFNHTSNGTVSVSFSPGGYTLMSTAAIPAGEELSISYGNHSNDFLLAEYGFIISDGVDWGNVWDEVRLDALLEGLFSEEQKEAVKERAYWGKWVLDREGVCYRTRVAVGLLRMGKGKWERMVDGGGESRERDVEEVLEKVFKEYVGVVEGNVKEIERSKEGKESQREILRERWLQIGDLVQGYLGKIEGKKT